VLIWRGENTMSTYDSRGKCFSLDLERKKKEKKVEKGVADVKY